MGLRVRVTDPTALDDLRRFLARRGCPSIPLGPDMLEVTVAPPHPEALRFDRLEQSLVQQHLRAFSSKRFGVRANVVQDDPWHTAGAR